MGTPIQREERAEVSAKLEALLFNTSEKVRNLGVVLDPDLNFKSHINTVTKSAYYHL